MKKTLLLILAMLLSLCCAAEGRKALEIPVPVLMEGGWQAPLTTDPEVLYDINMDQTDGSYQELFMRVDAINDEEGEIVDGNALVAMNTYIDGNGNRAEIRLALQDSEFGHVLIGYFGDITIYEFVDATYYTLEGLRLQKMEDPDPQFDWYFTSFHFPYGRLETLNGIRQDDNGYTYLLVRSDDTKSFEFVMRDGFVVSLRVYKNDGEHLTLSMTVDYTIEDAQPLPEEVKKAREGLKESDGTE